MREGDSKLWLVLCGVVVPHQPAMLTLLLLSIFICVCEIIFYIKDYVSPISEWNLGQKARNM